MFLIFALRRTDILPTGDLGIRNAIRKAYGLAEMPTPAEVEALARAGGPIARWRAGISGAAWSRTPISEDFPQPEENFGSG